MCVKDKKNTETESDDNRRGVMFCQKKKKNRSKCN